MKQTIAIIILSILLVIAGFVAFNQWQATKELQERYTQLEQTINGERTDWKTKYNTALVTIHDKEIEVKVLDEKLKKELGKKPKVIEKIEIRTVLVDKQSGTLTVVPVGVTSSTSVTYPTMFAYKDFRIDAIADTRAQTFQYELHQDLGINVYRLDELTFKGEVLEFADGKLHKAYPIPAGKMKVDIMLKKPIAWRTGFNLMIGGGVGMDVKRMEGNYSVHGMANFISRGVTHLDSDWRVLSLGAGSAGLVLVPVSYRISNVIPLLSDMFIDPYLNESYNLQHTFIGLGLSSTF